MKTVQKVPAKKSSWMREVRQTAVPNVVTVTKLARRKTMRDYLTSSPWYMPADLFAEFVEFYQNMAEGDSVGKWWNENVRPLQNTEEAKEALAN